ncbi:MAG: DUF3311 domain-containing protein [Gammaproteobacteria bacterium]|jgi:hypothetical protein|nr:DUF3311 domain-containing protein [Gammaproteobacteria bacterium]
MAGSGSFPTETNVMIDKRACGPAAPTARPKRRLRALARVSGGLLVLLVPCVAVLDVPAFNRVEPRVFGVPFIDAYLLFWVLALTPFLILAAYLMPSPDEP